MARVVNAPRRATASNPSPSGIPQGTPGGQGRRPGRRTMQAGDEVYLWILVLVELGLMAFLRHHFRRYHGG